VLGVPAGPGGPGGPDGPVGPVAPCGPVGPVGPVAPVGPGGPGGPAGPVGPVGPDTPTDQVPSPRKNVVLLAVPEARRAVPTVPVEILEAFREVRDAPDPLNVVAVIVAPAKLPDASRATIVDAPLAEDAEVRALSRVPVDMFDAFRDVIDEPLAVITLAEKLPDASLATMVDAPLLDEAVVLALAIVPLEMFEAFRLVMFAPENVAVLDPVPPLATGRTAD